MLGILFTAIDQLRKNWQKLQNKVIYEMTICIYAVNVWLREYAPLMQ